MTEIKQDVAVLGKCKPLFGCRSNDRTGTLVSGHTVCTGQALSKNGEVGFDLLIVDQLL